MNKTTHTPLPKPFWEYAVVSLRGGQPTPVGLTLQNYKRCESIIRTLLLDRKNSRDDYSIVGAPDLAKMLERGELTNPHYELTAWDHFTRNVRTQSESR